jgi:hypothetical protein
MNIDDPLEMKFLEVRYDKSKSTKTTENEPFV